MSFVADLFRWRKSPAKAFEALKQACISGDIDTINKVLMVAKSSSVPPSSSSSSSSSSNVTDPCDIAFSISPPSSSSFLSSSPLPPSPSRKAFFKPSAELQLTSTNEWGSGDPLASAALMPAMATEQLDGEGGVNLANYSMIQLDTMVINKADEDGWTPLHIALHHGKFEAARSLLCESDLRVLVLTKDYSTPLHYAVQSASKLDGNLEGAPLSVLESLLERGSIINLQQRSGHSALHTSVAIGSFQVAQWLLDHGADVNLQTKFHSLSLTFSCKSHHSDPFHPL
jgi:hypothetical protein